MSNVLETHLAADYYCMTLVRQLIHLFQADCIDLVVYV